jgi:hypothetical protein
MKKLLTLTCAVMLMLTITYAQDIPARNTVFFELGGAAVFYSVNYERLVFPTTKHNLGLRVGASYIYMFDEYNRQMTSIPIGASYIRNLKKNKYFEGGFTVCPFYDQYHRDDNYALDDGVHNDLVIVPTLRLGIRKQPFNNGFFWNVLFQVTYTAVDNAKDFKWDDAEKNVFPFGSVGLGWSF